MELPIGLPVNMRSLINFRFYYLWLSISNQRIDEITKEITSWRSIVGSTSDCTNLWLVTSIQRIDGITWAITSWYAIIGKL